MIERTRFQKYNTLNKLQKYQVRKRRNDRNGKHVMERMMGDSDYWFGYKLLTDREWMEMYWMDSVVLLQCLLSVRQTMFDAKREQIQKVIHQEHITDEIMRTMSSIRPKQKDKADHSAQFVHEPDPENKRFGQEECR